MNGVRPEGDDTPEIPADVLAFRALLDQAGNDGTVTYSDGSTLTRGSDGIWRRSSTRTATPTETTEH